MGALLILVVAGYSWCMTRSKANLALATIAMEKADASMQQLHALVSVQPRASE